MRTTKMRDAIRKTAPKVLPLLAAAVLASLANGCSKKTSAPDTTPPGAPAAVTVARGDGAATVTWSQVVAPDLKGYYPYRRPTAGGTTVQGTLEPVTADREVFISGLTNGTSYDFWVTAVDEADNESASSPVASATPNNAANLTAEGWTAWESADYTTARAKFQDAFNFTSGHPDARNGLGWTDLKEGSLSTAATNFDLAISSGLTTQDARVGGLIVNRDLAGQLAKAANLGSAALSAAPNYVFGHDSTVNADLARVVLAQVYFRMGEGSFANAQSQADALLVGNSLPASGLDPGTPGTWTVDSVVYPTYAGALLALIEYVYTLL